MPIPDLAKAAFAPNQGEIAEPVKTALGWHVIVVDKVEPAKVTPLADARADIAEAIKRKRAGDILDRLREDADDGLGADLPLDKIAGQIGVKLLRIPAIDSAGRNAAGAAIGGLPDDARFLQRIFEQDVGRDDRDVIERKDGAFFIVQVDRITPSRIIPLKNIEQRVTADWTADARTDALKVRADGLVQQIRAGADIETVARRAGASLKNSSPLNRYGATGDPDVSGQLRDALFKAPAGGRVGRRARRQRLFGRGAGGDRKRRRRRAESPVDPRQRENVDRPGTAGAVRRHAAPDLSGHDRPRRHRQAVLPRGPAAAGLLGNGARRSRSGLEHG